MNNKPNHSCTSIVRSLQSVADIEQQLLCTYLYASCSLKRQADQNCPPSQLDYVKRWDKRLNNLALQRIQHIALINALLAAFDAPPHFLHHHSSSTLLQAFTLSTAQRMVCLEVKDLDDLDFGIRELLLEWGYEKYQQEAATSKTLDTYYQQIKTEVMELDNSFAFSQQDRQVDIHSRYQLYTPQINEKQSVLTILDIISQPGTALGQEWNAQQPFILLFDTAMEYQMLVNVNAPKTTTFTPYLNFSTAPKRADISNPYTLKVFDLFNYAYTTQQYILTGLYGWYRIPADYPHLSAALREIAFDPMTLLLTESLSNILRVLPRHADPQEMASPAFCVTGKDQEWLTIDLNRYPDWSTNKRFRFYQNIEFYIQRLDYIIGQVQQISEQVPRHLPVKKQRGVGLEFERIKQNVFKMADDLRRVYHTGIGSQLKTV